MQASLYDLRMDYWNQSYKHWLSEEFLSFPWFFNIIFLFVLYTIWIKLVDKRRLRELLLFGSLIAVAAAFIDVVGITIGLWEYKVRLFPVSPALIPFDYSIVPILYMLVLQYTSSWKNFLIGSLLVSSINCFIINPVYAALGILKYHKFNYFYMFILIISATTIIKGIFNWIINIENKQHTDS